MECETCFDGYYLTNAKSKDGNLECVKCSEGCSNCYDEDYCLECENGYELADVDGKIICEEN